MPKRKSSSSSGPTKRSRSSSASSHWRFPAGHAMARSGFSSVARSRGAAVTGEMKYFDCENTGTAIAATTTTWVAGTMVDPTSTINLGSAAVATPLCLFAPTVGAGLNQRIGRQCKVFKVKVHGHFNVPVQAAQGTADAPCVIRAMLVQDMQTNSAQMTGAQLMQDTSASAACTLQTFQNPNNFGRFKVLKEKWFTVRDMNLVGSPTAADVVQQGTIIPFKMARKFKFPTLVHFNATNGGTVADIVDNSFHLVIGTSSAAYVPSIFYMTRVSFKE